MDMSNNDLMLGRRCSVMETCYRDNCHSRSSYCGGYCSGYCSGYRSGSAVIIVRLRLLYIFDKPLNIKRH